jgi:hypothetical protein
MRMARTNKISEEREQALVFEQMGRITSEWRFLEDNLEAVFDALVDSPHRSLPSAIYYSINGFQARLKIIDTLLKFRFAADDKSAKQPLRLREWANLRKRLNALVPLRNIVAHTYVFPIYKPYKGEKVRRRRKRQRTSLHPSIFDGSLAVRYNPTSHPTLYLNDLIRIRARIERAWKSVETFWSKIPEYRGRRRA